MITNEAMQCLKCGARYRDTGQFKAHIEMDHAFSPDVAMKLIEEAEARVTRGLGMYAPVDYATGKSPDRITVRDEFAKAALTGMLGGPAKWCTDESAQYIGDQALADNAYRLADAMLKAREESK